MQPRLEHAQRTICRLRSVQPVKPFQIMARRGACRQLVFGYAHGVGAQVRRSTRCTYTAATIPPSCPCCAHWGWRSTGECCSALTSATGSTPFTLQRGAVVFMIQPLLITW